jgi:hypothetical protein
MREEFLNCWKIIGCGREKGGCNESKDGECLVSKMDMGHSCWVIAGSFGSETPFCPRLKQDGTHCIKCKVFELYCRSGKLKGSKIKAKFPEEEKKYTKLMIERHEKKGNGTT